MRKSIFLILFLSYFINKDAYSFSLPIFARCYEDSVFSKQKQSPDFIFLPTKSEYNRLYSENSFLEVNNPCLEYCLDFSGDRNASLAVYTAQGFSRLRNNNSLLSLMSLQNGRPHLEERLNVSTRDLVDLLIYNLFVSNNRCATYLSNAISNCLLKIFNDPDSYEKKSTAEATRQEKVAANVAVMLFETAPTTNQKSQQSPLKYQNNITTAMEVARRGLIAEQEKFIQNISGGGDDLYVNLSKYSLLPIDSIDGQLIDFGTSQSGLRNVCLFNTTLAYYMARNIDFSARSFYELSSVKGSLVSQIFYALLDRLSSLKQKPSKLMPFLEYSSKIGEPSERIDQKTYEAIIRIISASLEKTYTVIAKAKSGEFDTINQEDINVLHEIANSKDYFSEYFLDEPLNILMTILAFRQKGTIPDYQYVINAITRLLGINVLVSRQIDDDKKFTISEQYINNRYAPFIMIYFSNGHFQLLRSLDSIQADENKKHIEPSWIKIEPSKTITIQPDAYKPL